LTNWNERRFRSVAKERSWGGSISVGSLMMSIVGVRIEFVCDVNMHVVPKLYLNHAFVFSNSVATFTILRTVAMEVMTDQEIKKNAMGVLGSQCS